MATQLEVSQAIRDKMNDIVESVILGRATPDQAIATAEQAMAPIIASYNKSVGQ